jgi:hypothetical protein
MAIKRFSDGSSIKNTFKLSRGATSVAKPTEPTIGTATATGPTTATVAYTASSLGGTPVSFTALSNPGSLTGTGSSPITVTGLTALTSYTFTVKATNANGDSPFTSSSNQITTEAQTLSGFVGLDSYTFASNTLNTVTFNSIDPGYKHLFIIYQAQGTVNDGTRLRFNGDSGTGNYIAAGGFGAYGNTFSVATPASANGITDQFSLLGASYGATQSTAAWAYINDYSKTNKIKSITGMSSNFNSANEGGVALLAGARTGSLEAINSITIVARTGNFNTGSTVALFGVN